MDVRGVKLPPLLDHFVLKVDHFQERLLVGTVKGLVDDRVDVFRRGLVERGSAGYLEDPPRSSADPLSAPRAFQP